MLSTPAAMVMSHTPDWIRFAAKWIACCDEPALAVHGGCGHLDREPRGEDRLARDVDRLLPRLYDAPEDDVADHRGIDRCPAGHLAQHVRGEDDRMHVAEITVALGAAAHRGSHRFDDHDVSHVAPGTWSGRHQR